VKCEYANLFLNDYADAQLTDEQNSAIQNHIEICLKCREALTEIQGVKKEVRAIHLADNISDDFMDQAIENAIKHAKHNHHLQTSRSTMRSKLSYIAIAASFLIVFSLGFMFIDEKDSNIQIVQEQDINLLFEATETLANVTFTVILPANIEMPGYPGSKQISWQGSIHQGKNLLSIPIINLGTKKGTISAELQHQNKKRTFKINIKNGKPIKQVT